MTLAVLRSRAAAAALIALSLAAPAWAQPAADRVRAKTLFFDRKYAEARTAWEAVRAAKGADAEAAAYWIARCSEGLGEHERALGEYTAFLALHPKDRTLAEEAETGRVGVAARLYRGGAKQHAGVLREAIGSPSKTVRYYAALQMGGLDAEMGRRAVPVLKRIVAEEKDADLVDRAKILLLRWDPSALSASAAADPPKAGGREAHWFRLRITEKGASRPKVAISLPMGLAEMLFKSLPEDAKQELRKGGYDAATFWDKLRQLGPSEIISIEGDEGERIQIWTEE
jgi:hypothetical protein